MELKRIASFAVDHRKLERGLYVSRVDGEVATYDIRMKRPNAEPVLANPALHTIEHLVATYLRSSASSEHILYFGPMGCRTGFYLLVRGLSRPAVIDLVRDAFEFLASYEGEIPGASEAECGNWRDHDLEAARMEARAYVPILNECSLSQLEYPS